MIGNKIKALRKESGLTQKQLVSKIGDITHQQISSWERGNHIPHLYFIQKIADAFGVAVSSLIE